MTQDQFIQEGKVLFKIKLTDLEWLKLYNDFLISERMFQDYLDIYRGENTRDPNFVMPYEHPFFDYLTPRIQAKIKYVLIGEAKPLDSETFLYNPYHNSSTKYLTALRDAWGFNLQESKVDLLCEFAQRGILLIDLFPYSIKYSTNKRKNLVRDAIPLIYFNSGHVHSLISRLSTISNLLDNDWDLAFMTPVTISEYLVECDPILLENVNCLKYHDNHRSIELNVKRRSNYKKIVVDTSGNPNKDLIQIAFDL